MKFTASHIKLNRADSYLLGMPARSYKWSEMTLLRSVAQLELKAELDRECDYVESVCQDIDIAMMSTAGQGYQTERLAKVMLKLETCSNLDYEGAGVVR